MTVKELRLLIDAIPIARNDEEIQIYVRGPISGIVDIERLDLTENAITVDSFYMREDRSKEKI